MSCLDDGGEITWQMERGSTPRIWPSLAKARVEGLGDGDIKPIGMN